MVISEPFQFIIPVVLAILCVDINGKSIFTRIINFLFLPQPQYIYKLLSTDARAEIFLNELLAKKSEFSSDEERNYFIDYCNTHKEKLNNKHAKHVSKVAWIISPQGILQQDACAAFIISLFSFIYYGIILSNFSEASSNYFTMGVVLLATQLFFCISALEVFIYFSLARRKGVSAKAARNPTGNKFLTNQSSLSQICHTPLQRVISHINKLAFG